jgi:hypothetical protein
MYLSCEGVKCDADTTCSYLGECVTAQVDPALREPTDKSGALVCIDIGGDDRNCPKDAERKGVEGTSIKGCRFRN